jgi:putative hydrolase of the HAD superfamily
VGRTWPDLFYGTVGPGHGDDPVIRSVMFDFGGVLTSSPFEAFGRYEEEQGLPSGILRTINATDPDSNAWARFERGQLDVDGFALAFEAEASALGHRVDSRAVLSLLRGELRPAMVEAVRRCGQRFATACLTNNFSTDDLPTPPEVQDVYDLFDLVVESKAVGIRKPEPRFYQLACQALDVQPTEVIYLDDLGINLKPARAMGMHTIKVTDPALALSELSLLTGLTFEP